MKLQGRENCEGRIIGPEEISFQLMWEPERKFLSQIFIMMAIARNLAGAITNPLKKMMANIIVTEILM